MNDNKKEREKMSLNSLVAIGTSLFTCIAIACGVAYASGQQKEFINHANQKTEAFHVACEKSDDKIDDRMSTVEKNDRKQDIQLQVFIVTMQQIQKELSEINEKMDIDRR